VTHGNSKEKYTTLILGAGASKHLKYPLGRGLVENIYELKGKIEESPWSENELNTFFDNLREYEPDSIDEYLGRQQKRKMISQVDIGKFLISRVLKDNESKEKLFHDSGWYRILRNYLMDGVGNFKKTKPLAIITFNYDRSLEAYLHRRYHARCSDKRISWEDSWAELQEQLPIIHVHGMLGSYPKIPYEEKFEDNDLLKLSKEIKIIHELTKIKNGFANEEFKLANEYLIKSDKIVFMGFGLHKENIERLNYFNTKNMHGLLEISGAFGNISEFEFSKILENNDSRQLKKDMKEARKNHKVMFVTCDEFVRYQELIDLSK
jgi:hypothetical protein